MNGLDDLDIDFFEEIIEGAIENLLKNIFGLDEKSDIQNIFEYQPVWTLDSDTKEKILSYLNLRLKDTIPSFKKIEIESIEDVGATPAELLKFLKKKDAVKIAATL
tara:strand:- start:206 stop:523 length:318 start_codon:yes stop_codon:yes gene_type:complete